MTLPVPPPFVELPRYTKDSLPLGPYQTFRKTTTTDMVRLTGAFTCDTINGTVLCQDGWLAIDSAGYPYPITVDEQANTYELVPDEPDEK